MSSKPGEVRCASCNQLKLAGFRFHPQFRYLWLPLFYYLSIRERPCIVLLFELMSTMYYAFPGAMSCLKLNWINGSRILAYMLGGPGYISGVW